MDLGELVNQNTDSGPVAVSALLEGVGALQGGGVRPLYLGLPPGPAASSEQPRQDAAWGRQASSSGCDGPETDLANTRCRDKMGFSWRSGERDLGTVVPKDSGLWETEAPTAPSVQELKPLGKRP